jgi:hypothetical protein
MPFSRCAFPGAVVVRDNGVVYGGCEDGVLAYDGQNFTTVISQNYCAGSTSLFLSSSRVYTACTSGGVFSASLTSGAVSILTTPAQCPRSTSVTVSADGANVFAACSDYTNSVIAISGGVITRLMDGGQCAQATDVVSYSNVLYVVCELSGVFAINLSKFVVPTLLPSSQPLTTSTMLTHTPLPDVTMFVKFTLEIDVTLFMFNSSMQETLTGEISALLRISVSRVSIVSISSGSAVVTVAIESAGNTGEMTAAAAANAFVAAATKRDFSASLTLLSLIVATSVFLQPPSPASSSSSSSSFSFGLILGLAVGIVLVAIVTGCVCWRKRSKANRNSTVTRRKEASSVALSAAPSQSAEAAAAAVSAAPVVTPSSAPLNYSLPSMEPPLYSAAVSEPFVPHHFRFYSAQSDGLQPLPPASAMSQLTAAPAAQPGTAAAGAALSRAANYSMYPYVPATQAVSDYREEGRTA